MRIIKAYPPMFRQIADAFPTIKGRPGIVFAWGDTIYNPTGGTLPQWIIDHEEEHGRRQREGEEDPIVLAASARRWWQWYIKDRAFRLHEEVHAHRAEWASIRANPKLSEELRQAHLLMMADRLSGSLYGNLIGIGGALEAITKEPFA